MCKRLEWGLLEILFDEFPNEVLTGEWIEGVGDRVLSRIVGGVGVYIDLLEVVEGSGVVDDRSGETAPNPEKM